jgi:hypothetical protein
MLLGALASLKFILRRLRIWVAGTSPAMTDQNLWLK